jgi:hypothetical protein
MFKLNEIGKPFAIGLSCIKALVQQIRRNGMEDLTPIIINIALDGPLGCYSESDGQIVTKTTRHDLSQHFATHTSSDVGGTLRRMVPRKFSLSKLILVGLRISQ